jgi:hypothetical protein
MAAPIAAIASSPAMRAIALLIPEAMPALDSSPSARTVAMGGATVQARPIEKISRAGKQVGEVVHVGLEAQHQRKAEGGDQRAEAHEQARPEAVREPPGALGQDEHHDR